MKNDRFFVFLILGITLIVIISFVFVLSNQNKVDYLPDNTPEGTVNNYLLAWINSDYKTIEKYLVDLDDKPEVDNIINTINENEYSLTDAGVSIDDILEEDDFATVTVTIMHTGTGYDSYRYDNGDVFTLIKMDGEWKIQEAPYPFWGWNWYQNEQIYKD